MISKIHALAAGLAALALVGCSKSPVEPPLPTVQPAQTGSVPGVSGAVDVSVPPAAAVFAGSSASSPDATQGRTNKSLSATQESTAMPMPGQNNDHSAPLIPAKPASSP